MEHQYQYNITIRTDGRPSLTEEALLKAVVTAISKQDEEAERYGPNLAGYTIEVQTVMRPL